MNYTIGLNHIDLVSWFFLLNLDDSLKEDIDDSTLDEHNDTSKEDDLDEPYDGDLYDIDDSDVEEHEDSSEEEDLDTFDGDIPLLRAPQPLAQPCTACRR